MDELIAFLSDWIHYAHDTTNKKPSDQLEYDGFNVQVSQEKEDDHAIVVFKLFGASKDIFPLMLYFPHNQSLELFYGIEEGSSATWPEEIAKYTNVRRPSEGQKEMRYPKSLRAGILSIEVQDSGLIVTDYYASLDKTPRNQSMTEAQILEKIHRVTNAYKSLA